MAKDSKTNTNTPATPATIEKGGVSTISDMPDFLKKSSGIGNENVTNNDLVIPRLQIVQSQSPELDADDAKYIPEAKVGQMFNSLTREVYDSITICDVYFRKEFAVFVKKTEGGGFRGSKPTMEEAVALVEASEKPSTMEIVETALHFALIVDTMGKVVGEIVIPMTSTKLKVSRNLNSMIRMRGGDRFAGTRVITTKKEKNDKGTFYNFAVGSGPWVNEDTYNKAQLAYKAVSEGVKDVDRSDMEGSAKPPTDEEEF